MAKVFTYITIVLAIFAMFSMFGIADTTTSQLLRAISFDNPENFKTFDLFSIIFSSATGIIASVAGAGAIIVGLFTRQSTESILLAGFTSIIAGWIIGDMITVITITNATFSSTLPFFAKIVKYFFMIFCGSFIIAIVEWWKGVD